MTPVAQALNVSKHFGMTTALDDVSIAVRPGSVHALVGRNGAGKSTLVSLLTGLAGPDSGSVSFNGEKAPSLADRSAWRALGACVITIVLAGYETPRLDGPLALVDMLRAAASEIEEYGRVVLDGQHGVWVSESAATDTVHLLAELLENATTFSPETTQVIVSGHAVVGGGSLITITDSGTGMTEE